MASSDPSRSRCLGFGVEGVGLASEVEGPLVRLPHAQRLRLPLLEGERPLLTTYWSEST